MARADIFTLLPLDTFAKFLGFSPLHFNGGRVPGVVGAEPFTIAGNQLNQRPLWHRYSWQDPNQLSHEELAELISVAEADVANFIGYWPAPMWISQEVHKYPKFYRSDYLGNGIDVSGQMKGIKLQSAKVITPGRRAVTLIGTATVAAGTLTYSDPEGTGFNTLATIVLPTTVSSECEIIVCLPGYGGDQLSMIRPLRTVTIAGGFVTITIDSWLLFAEQIVDMIPVGEITAIDASAADSYCNSIEVYREYNDSTEPSATFYWERDPQSYIPISTCSCGGVGCEACSMITQNGCFAIKDAENGVVSPVPAVYSEDDLVWNKSCWTECREPDMVKLWYRAGNVSQRWLNGSSCDPMDKILAKCICMIAAARVPFHDRKPDNVENAFEFYRRDIAESGEKVNTIFTPPNVLSNPFGTRRGEVLAYNTLRQTIKRKCRVSAVMA